MLLYDRATFERQQILNEFQPSHLPKIQILLREDILQTLVIRVYLTMVSDEKMPPGLQCMYYSS